MLLELLRSEVEPKGVLKELQVELAEAVQVTLLHHDFEYEHEFVELVPERGHALREEQPEVFVELVGLLAADEVEVLLGELEGRLLEVDSAGGHAEDEAEVDVDDVALHVEQDVAVVPVLELEHVGEDGGAGQRGHEVLPRRLQLLLRGEHLREELPQLPLPLLPPPLHLVHRNRVLHELQQSRVLTQHDDLVGLQEHLHPRLLQHLFHLENQLHADYLLPQVVPAFHHHVPLSQALEFAEKRVTPVQGRLLLPGLPENAL